MSSLIKLTGIWKHIAADGSVMYKGQLSTSCRIIIMKNTLKSKDSDPDFNVYLDKIDLKKEVVTEVDSNSL